MSERPVIVAVIAMSAFALISVALGWQLKTALVEIEREHTMQACIARGHLPDRFGVCK